MIILYTDKIKNISKFFVFKNLLLIDGKHLCKKDYFLYINNFCNEILNKKIYTSAQLLKIK
jgi:hypothetical protein